MIESASGVPDASTQRQPIICPLKATAQMSPGSIVRISSRVESHTARHQSSGFCSAQLPL